jgi:hydroxypyruvate isomerase
VADVPGRHEPGTGELNFRFIAQVLRDVGYQGLVGLEAYPLADSHQAMERFRAAFEE